MLKKVIKLAFFLCLIFTTKLSYSQSIQGFGADISNISPLMNAVNSGDVEGVKFFSKAGRAVLDRRNIGGATALHVASRNKNLEIVKILIEAGADVNISDNNDWTPLMRAAANENPEIVKELLAVGADANKKNSIGQTAIIHSVNAKCPKCLSLVLEYIDYKTINKRLLDRQFKQAFNIANRKGDKESMEILNIYKDKITQKDFPVTKNYKVQNDVSDLDNLSWPMNRNFKNYILRPSNKENPYNAVDNVIQRDLLLNNNSYKLAKPEESNNIKTTKSQNFVFKRSKKKKEQGVDSNLENITQDSIAEEKKFIFSNEQKPKEEQINNDKEIKDVNAQPKSFVFQRMKKDEENALTQDNKAEELKINDKKGFFSFFRKKKNKITEEEIEGVIESDIKSIKKNEIDNLNSQNKKFKFKSNNKEQGNAGNIQNITDQSYEKPLEKEAKKGGFFSFFRKKDKEEINKDIKNNTKQEVAQDNKFTFKRAKKPQTLTTEEKITEDLGDFDYHNNSEEKRFTFKRELTGKNSQEQSISEQNTFFKFFKKK